MVAMIGFGISDFFIVHTFTLVTGQLGHANIKISLGPLKYLFNGPQMHLWHHAKNIPEQIKDIQPKMIANEWLIFSPRKKYLQQPNNNRRTHQPIEVVVPTWIQDFMDKVIPIT